MTSTDPHRGLMGVHEVAAYLGIGRQRVHQLRKEHNDFPTPAALSCGHVFFTTEIEAWKTAHPNRTAGRHTTST